jgi:plastocyanin
VVEKLFLENHAWFGTEVCFVWVGFGIMVVHCQKKSMCYWLISLVLALVFFGASSLAGSASSVTLTPDQDGVQRIKIFLDSYFYSPNEIIIQASKPVSIELENQSFLISHNFVIDNSEMGIHHEINVSAGDTENLQLLLTKPGRYTFYCNKQLLFFPSHDEEGMEGVLEVR